MLQSASGDKTLIKKLLVDIITTCTNGTNYTFHCAIYVAPCHDMEPIVLRNADAKFIRTTVCTLWTALCSTVVPDINYPG